MPQDEFRWPCAQCGAQLRYAPGQTHLVCDHCGHEQEIPAEAPRTRARALQELDLAKGLRDDLPSGDMVEVRTSSCPNCGAKVEIGGATHATACPFCDTPVVLDTGSERHIKPQALVPFVLSEAEARKAMVAWMGSLWFAPGTLLEYARKGRALNGVYVPFWTFDAATSSRYSGERGEYYYETRTVSVRVNGRTEQRQEQVRRTRWYSTSGRVARDFDDVLVMASRSLPTRLGNELTPWDLSALTPYNPEFLAGFQAEGYTVNLAAGHDEAQDRMSAVILQDVRHDIGGDEQRVHDVDTDWSDETFKHILLPVWMAAYRYGGKSYRFLVNGQTGEVQGERPWSVWKIASAAILVVLLVLGAIYLADLEAVGLSEPDWMN
ncbi:primosomal protein N' (replication factor Y) - superfamily II helicase [Tabrizicola sp.]|uniref:primosomal protein N' (replication factor Y) - superfamily II helicase n=1 Tax=Tabrizicola sp. TaxID=2005166 RepID=UPI001A628397|nr:primosomal protein N' (replication factor Y) - superfamily II helicase [Tabrizicola sp.]MBL9075051.1 primosomal protein N' (replication factor Y) - superfamily II helicase [Tabrizicola sp.]